MESGYGNMNMHSYPYQMNQTHYVPHCYPRTDGFPAQMYATPTQPPAGYGYWPWANNCGHTCNGCHSHSYWPSHCAWGSAYAHAHAPPFYCAGSCPPGPFQHMPMPGHSMEKPLRYEYEKNVPWSHHCCGCPDRPSHHKEQKAVRIEEEEPDKARMNDAPSRPIVWIPPDLGKEGNKKDLEDLKQQPTVWNGWYPYNLNNVVSSKPKGDTERKDSGQEDAKGRFPFPLLWIPYKPDQNEKEKNVNETTKNLSLESEKGSAGAGDLNLTVKDHDNDGDRAPTRVKEIPVKRIEQHEDDGCPIPKNQDQGQERNGTLNNSTGDSKKKLESGEKKSSKDGAKKKSPSSSPKSSKLPPVCLRVDPYPRKKNVNGSSRSPSPPRNKQNQDHLSSESSQALGTSEKMTDKLNNGITKTVEVKAGRSEKKEDADIMRKSVVDVPVTSQDNSKVETKDNPQERSITPECIESNDEITGDVPEGFGSVIGEKEELKAEELSVNGPMEFDKAKLSEEEAATVIQSAYRGFNVRRLEPIKKLKQIAKVRDQIAELKQLIQSMELSSDIQSKSKQRNIIAETIMSLLLKLDMIQGLHPSIREIRKCVVKELVTLQEEVDSLMNEKAENATGSLEASHERHENQHKGLSNHDENLETSEVNPTRAMPGGLGYGAVEICESASEPSMENDEKKSDETPLSDSPYNDEKIIEACENNEAPQSSQIAVLQTDSWIMETEESVGDDEKNIEVSAVEGTNSAGTNTETVGIENAELPQGMVGKSLSELTIDHNGKDDEIQHDETFRPKEDQHEDVFHKNSLASEQTDADRPENNVNLIEGDAVQEENPGQTEMEAPIASKSDNIHGTSMEERRIEAPTTYDTAAMEEEIHGDTINSCIEADNKSGNIEEEEKIEAPITVNTHDTSAVEEIHDDTFNKCTKVDDKSEKIEEQAQIEAPITLNTHDTSAMEEIHDDTINKCIEAGDKSGHIEEAQIEVQNDISSMEEIHDWSNQGNNAFINCNKMDDKFVTEEITTAKSPSNKCDFGEDHGNDEVAKTMEENKRLREMVEKLIRSGEEQVNAISRLSGRVKDLEKKLSKKKKLRLKQYKAQKSLDQM